MKRVEWADCKVYSVNGDTFTAGGIGASSDSAITFPLVPNQTTGLFAPIAVGEHISAHIRMESKTASGSWDCPAMLWRLDDVRWAPVSYTVVL